MLLSYLHFVKRTFLVKNDYSVINDYWNKSRSFKLTIIKNSVLEINDNIN